MNELSVRGHWITGGVKFMRTHHTPEASERLLGSLPKALRATLAEIQPVQWCQRSYHVDIMNAIVSARRDEVAAYESLLTYGQLVASDLASGALRPLMKILSPKLLATRLPNMWSIDHQQDGVLETDIAQIDQNRLSLRLGSLDGYDHIGVVTLGWVRGLLQALGRRDVVVKQEGWSLGHVAPGEMTGEVRWS
jgi:hypothetical protein